MAFRKFTPRPRLVQGDNESKGTSDASLPCFEERMQMIDPDTILQANVNAGSPEQIIQSILGNTPLDEQSLNNLWASLSYGFITKWKRELPPVADKVQSAICALSYAYKIRRASFMNFADELAFRGGQ